MYTGNQCFIPNIQVWDFSIYFSFSVKFNNMERGKSIRVDIPEETG